jgi:uncharacterized protein YdeI (YjbR/CyaY-like superfamily)
VQPTFFARPADFRAWLRRHHQQRAELWVGFHKKATGRPSITYPEALDEALCFGWIDGVRKAVDADSFMQRFTPRKPGSFWSAVNTRKAQALIEAKRMHASGLAAFQARDAQRTAEYSYERARSFGPAELKRFKANSQAWKYFAALPPGYRRVSTWYVISAKREDTRARRLAQLIACSARGERLPGLPQPKGRP